MKKLLVLGAFALSALSLGANIVARLAAGADPAVVGARFGLTLVDTTANAPFALYLVPNGGNAEAIEEAMALDPEVVWAEDDGDLDMPENTGGGKATTIGAVGDGAFYAFNSGLLEQVHWVAPVPAGPVPRVRVAILDTGYAPCHKEIRNRVVAEANYVEPGEFPGDYPRGTDTNADGEFDAAAGHGTMVAGIVASLSPNAGLVIVRIADSDGFSTAWRIIKGIAFSVNAGCKLANLSLGSLEDIPAISDVLEWAEDNDLLLITAAGNNSQHVEFFPAKLSKAVGVSAIDATDRKAPFSNWDGSLDAAAPGTGIASFYYDGSMAVWSGTSFSTPIMTAALASALDSARLSATPDSLRRLVEATGDNIDPLNTAFAGGVGRKVNFWRLRSALRGLLFWVPV